MIDISETVTLDEKQWNDVISRLRRLCGIGKNPCEVKMVSAEGGRYARFLRVLPVLAVMYAPLSFWDRYSKKKNFVFLPCNRVVGNGSYMECSVITNYEFLAKMYSDRKLTGVTGKQIRNWIKSLPHSELITGENYEEDTDGDTDV